MCNGLNTIIYTNKTEPCGYSPPFEEGYVETGGVVVNKCKQVHLEDKAVFVLRLSTVQLWNKTQHDS